MKGNTIQKTSVLVFAVVFIFAFNGGSFASPYVSDLALTAHSGGVTCSYTLDEDPVSGDQLTAATAWYQDGSPIMVLYLPFEGGTTNSLTDYSGNSQPVEIYGPWSDPQWIPNGGHDGSGAYEFDGNDAFDAGDIFPVRSSYTKTAWIYRQVMGDEPWWNNIISGHSHDANNHCFRVSNLGILGAGHNGGTMAVTDPEAIEFETWYFVAVTFDYDTGVMRLYKNGVMVDSDTLAAEYWEVTDTGVYIGRMETDWMWQGKLDDCRIYDYVLSSDQILQMYQSGGNTIVPAEVSDGEQWQAEVTPFSSTVAGDTVLSDIFTIGDDDSDGVPNEADQCPGTPAGVEVDENGCSLSELDSDGDGVTDDLDLCPETPAGDEVDENGCSALQVDSDGDGTPDYLEQGPDPENPDPEYDGNEDGIADYLQNTVASCFTNDGEYYVTLVVTDPAGATLADVEALEPASVPDETEFPYGSISFTINGVDVGGTAAVDLYLPDGGDCDTYYKYGRTQDDQTEHWYEFLYDDTTDTGAELDGNVITLYFVDGARGDDDLTEDGVIMDDGAPADNTPPVTPEAVDDDDDDDYCFVSIGARSSQAAMHLALVFLFVFILAGLARLEIKRTAK